MFLLLAGNRRTGLFRAIASQAPHNRRTSAATRITLCKLRMAQSLSSKNKTPIGVIHGTQPSIISGSCRAQVLRVGRARCVKRTRRLRQQCAAVSVRWPSDHPGAMSGQPGLVRTAGACRVRRCVRYGAPVDRRRSAYLAVRMQGEVRPGEAASDNRAWQMQQQPDQIRLAVRRRLLVDRLQLLADGVVLHADTQRNVL